MSYYRMILMVVFFMSSICVNEASCAELRPNKVNTYIPEAGFVPDKDTASKIAEAVAIPIYGKNRIEKEKPLIAELNGNVWIVKGTFHRSIFSRSYGGIVIVEIDKRDGRIISIIHEK